MTLTEVWLAESHEQYEPSHLIDVCATMDGAKERAQGAADHNARNVAELLGKDEAAIDAVTSAEPLVWEESPWSRQRTGDADGAPRAFVAYPEGPVYYTITRRSLRP